MDHEEQINIVIVHGNTGYPTKNWFPWLVEELKKGPGQKHKLNFVVAQYPTEPSGLTPVAGPDTPSEMLSFKNQSRGKWDEVFERVTQGLEPSRTILVGHSLGGLYVLDRTNDQGARVRVSDASPYAKVIAVCPVGLDGETAGLHPDAVANLRTFRAIDPDNVRLGASGISVFVGEVDKIVNPKDSVELARLVRADNLVLLKDHGHCYEGEGCVTLPPVFDEVIKAIAYVASASI